MPEAAPRALRFTLIFMSLHALLWLVCMGLLVVYVPAAMQMFRDFNLLVPAATLLVFTLGRLAGNYWYLAAPLLLCWLAFEGSLLALLYPRQRKLAWLWGCFNVLLPLLFIAFVVYVIESVRLTLVDGLSR